MKAGQYEMGLKLGVAMVHIQIRLNMGKKGTIFGVANHFTCHK
jgi:hypothetical protein